jgi:hypothetical protein
MRTRWLGRPSSRRARRARSAGHRAWRCNARWVVAGMRGRRRHRRPGRAPGPCVAARHEGRLDRPAPRRGAAIAPPAGALGAPAPVQRADDRLVRDLSTPLMAVNLSAEVARAGSHEEVVRQTARPPSRPVCRVSVTRLSTWSGFRAICGRWRAASSPRLAAHTVARFEITWERDFAGVFDPALLERAIANVVGTAFEHVGEVDPITIRLDGTQRDRL